MDDGVYLLKPTFSLVLSRLA